MATKLAGYSYKDVSIFTKSIHEMNWSLDGSQLAVASYDRTYKICQLEANGSMKMIQSISCISGGATQIKWHPYEKQRFVVAGDDLGIDLWDVRAAKYSSRLGSSGGNLFVAWSPNGKYISSINKNDVLTVYDVISGQIIKDLKFANEINEMIWSANSDYIIIASGLGGIEIVHFQDDSLSKLDFVLAHTSNCHQLKLWEANDRSPAATSSRQKALMALGGADFQVTLWDVDDLICHTTICLESEVRGISISGDGDYLAIVSEDPNISLYSTTSGKCVGKADARTTFQGIAWHPTANIIAASTDDRAGNPTAGYLRLLSFNQLTS